MVARPWSSSRLSCGERLLLRCDGNAGNSIPTTQGKDPSSQARRRKPGSSGCGWDSRASSRVETGMSGNFLSCSKGVKDPLEVPEVRCDQHRDASVEMGLISPGGENLLDVLELGQVLSTSMGTTVTLSGGLRKGQFPCELHGGLSGFLSRRCGAYDLVWSRCRNLRILLQCRHGSWGTTVVSPAESVLVSSGGMHVRFPPEL